MYHDSTILAIKEIDPKDLHAKGILELAPDGNYVCPFCGNGSGKSGTGIKPNMKDGEWRYHCFKCNCSPDNIGVLAAHYGLDAKSDFREVIEHACNDFNISAIEERNVADFPLQPQKSKAISESDAAELIKLDLTEAQGKLEKMPVEGRRGLTLETLQYFGCGYLESWTPPSKRGQCPTSRRLIIPHEGSVGYAASMLESDRTEANKRYHKQHAGNKGIFGLKTLKSDAVTIFIFEGEIDAMSARQALALQLPQSISRLAFLATGGAANLDWLQYLDAVKFDYPPAVVIIFDNDDTGRSKAAQLEAEMIKRKYRAAAVFYPEVCQGKTDANQILRTFEGDADNNLYKLTKDAWNAANDKMQQLKEKMSQFSSPTAESPENAAESPTSPVNDAEGTSDTNEAPNPPKIDVDCTIGEYFSAGVFDEAVNVLREYGDRKSGFANLDGALVFVPGFYLVGAVPGAGKTTFCWQLLEQFAQNGEHCIFVSAEMTRLELYSKTLARRLYKRDRNATLTSFDLRRGGSSALVEEIKHQLLEEKISFRAVEASEMNIDQICDYLRKYTGQGRAPIICIDYLQRIRPAGKADNLKLAMDEVAYKLKEYQKSTQATIIAISSFNRDNYYAPAHYGSFKESGGIEYSADGLMALEYEDVYGEAAKVKEGLSAKETPRKMRLSILKNRNGKLDEVKFDYYAAHDYFEPEPPPIETRKI